MVSSLWRYAHLALAIISSFFLIILSLTGIVLSVNAVYEKTPNHKVENFDSLNLSQVIPDLQKVYPEIISVSVDHRGFVSIDAIDENSKTVKAYIDPNSGRPIAEIKIQSTFIQWTTALHRSLFLKETGRFIVGIISFLLILISVSGIALILKRQKGFKHFFKKIQNDFFAQYFHVITGRWTFIPILLIAFSGTFLFLLRLNAFQADAKEISMVSKHGEEDLARPLSEFSILKNTLLKDVEQIDFPFIPDDPEELFIIKLKEKSISINQITGKIVEQTIYPKNKFWERWNLDIHTGRTNILWAIILGIASLNILVFIYTGFIITIKRSKTKVRNKYTANQASIIILYGSENGSSLFFANKIHKQLMASGEKSFLTGLNQYQQFDNAKQVLIFSSTYGLGDPPSNASKFSSLVKNLPQTHQIEYSIIGFGSRAYPDFCAFAIEIDNLLSKQAWASSYLPIHFVDDKSTDDFLSWVNKYTEKSLVPLATSESAYSEKQKKMQQWKVIEKTSIVNDNSTFKVSLKPLSKVRFTSGDLLAIYPANDHRERLYSIGKYNNLLQLIVKKHEYGIGSSFLNDLQLGEVIKARLKSNKAFYFPKGAKEVALIFNGTGIAPFLGMIDQNIKKTPIYLYGGFRTNNAWIAQYKAYAEAQILQNKLVNFNFAFSRQEPFQYVMDLIVKDGDRFARILEDDGIIMICGALAMLRDVEKVLNVIVIEKNGKELSYYQERNQLIHDCY